MLRKPGSLSRFLSSHKKLRQPKNRSSQRRRQAFFETLEVRAVLTANVEILIPPGAPADLENPTAFLTSNNKLVVRGATGAAHNNQFEIKQDDLGNILGITVLIGQLQIALEPEFWPFPAPLA